MITFFVPPGIGDFSAMYAKLCCLDREIAIQASQDLPQRLFPFLGILPKIKPLPYGYFGTGLPLMSTLPPGTDLSSLPDGEYFLSINEWLEGGGRVDEWVPGLMNYHYEFNIPEPLKIAALNMVADVVNQPLVGVYTSAYGNSRHWGFWGADEWFMFLKLVRAGLPPETVFVFIGAEYDLEISDQVYDRMIQLNTEMGHDWFKSIYTIGQFHIGSTIELIRNLDYFFVFPSGLGFLADVVNTPHTMWFPQHLDRMRYTFSDPQNGDSGITKHELFSSPEAAASNFLQTGRRFLEESRDTNASKRIRAAS